MKVLAPEDLRLEKTVGFRLSSCFPYNRRVFVFDILVTMLFVFAHNSPAKMDPQGYEPLYICAHPAMLTGAPRLWIVGKSDRRYVKSFWRGHYDYTRLKRPVDEGLWTRYQSDEYDVAISAAFEPPARVTVRRSQLTYDCALHSTP